MAGFGALICPTTASRLARAGDDMVGGCVIDAVNLGYYMQLSLTLPFNINNRCPVLAVPSGHASNGMPTSVRIVGHPYDDATVSTSVLRRSSCVRGPPPRSPALALNLGTPTPRDGRIPPPLTSRS